MRSSLFHVFINNLFLNAVVKSCDSCFLVAHVHAVHGEMNVFDQLLLHFYVRASATRYQAMHLWPGKEVRLVPDKVPH